MSVAVEDTLRMAKLLVERLENIDLELLEAMSDPCRRCLDDLLAHRQECIASLTGLDVAALRRLDDAEKDELINKVKRLEKSGQRLVQEARRKRDEIARARRQNAVARRTARGYRPPALKLVAGRRLDV